MEAARSKEANTHYSRNRSAAFSEVRVRSPGRLCRLSHRSHGPTVIMQPSAARIIPDIPNTGREATFMVIEFFRDLFGIDSSSTSSSISSSTSNDSSSCSAAGETYRESELSKGSDPSVFNGWGCGAEIQSAAEASSISAGHSFSCTTETWGSIDSSSTSGGGSSFGSLFD